MLDNKYFILLFNIIFVIIIFNNFIFHKIFTLDNFTFNYLFEENICVYVPLFI